MVKVVVIDGCVEEHAFGVDVVGMGGGVALSDGTMRSHGALRDITIELVHVIGLKLTSGDASRTVKLCVHDDFAVGMLEGDVRFRTKKTIN